VGTKSPIFHTQAKLLVAILCCAVSLAVVGCFGNIVPPNIPAPTPFDEPPAEQPIVEDPNDGDEPLEPPMEEPIRPIDDPEIVETADLTGDGIVDQTDVDLFRGLFGVEAGDERFDAKADFDEDGMVTLVDFQIFLNLLAQ